MTGYTVHTGTSDEFAEGWDRIFSGSPSPRKTKKKAPSSKKKPAAKKKTKAKKGKS